MAKAIRCRPSKSAPMDWGGQLVNLSESGANIRLHPAAIAARDEICTLKLELDHMLFEAEGTVASYRTQSQYVTCGISLNFPDNYTRKAYQQLMTPVVVGSTLEESTGRVKQDLPGLVKEQYHGEAESMLSTWGEGARQGLEAFELLVHDYYIRGNTELPGLKIGYRDGAKVGSRVSTPAVPVPLSREHQAEVTKLFRFVVQNLTKSLPVGDAKIPGDLRGVTCRSRNRYEYRFRLGKPLRPARSPRRRPRCPAGSSRRRR